MGTNLVGAGAWFVLSILLLLQVEVAPGKTEAGTSVILSDPCTSLAYNIGSLRPSRNLHMSATGKSGTNGRHKSATESTTTRLQALQEFATVTLFPAAVLGSLVAPGEAEAKDGGSQGQQWISGKGAQPKGSEDKKGTRKETKYLRCLSNCLAECQKPTSAAEKNREDCLQLCQDECCTSYEQCTYAVTQNK